MFIKILFLIFGEDTLVLGQTNPGRTDPIPVLGSSLQIHQLQE